MKKEIININSQWGGIIHLQYKRKNRIIIFFFAKKEEAKQQEDIWLNNNFYGNSIDFKWSTKCNYLFFFLLSLLFNIILYNGLERLQKKKQQQNTCSSFQPSFLAISTFFYARYLESFIFLMCRNVRLISINSLTAISIKKFINKTKKKKWRKMRQI